MTVGRLARAAAIVALFGLLSRLLGFAREIVLAAAYGATGATDAFVNSLLIVNVVAAVLLYTLVTLIIPVFQRERAEHEADSAWRLVCALAVWTGLVLVVLASLAAIFPEALASIFQLDEPRAEDTAELIRIMSPALALQGFSAIFTALLQIHGRFAGPAAVGIAFNLGIIVGVLVGEGSIGIEAAAWGVAVGRGHAGAAAAAAVLAPAARGPRPPGPDPPAAGRGRAAGAAGARRLGAPAGRTTSPTSSSPRASRPAASRR